ncbi:MAG: DUF4242 domain-containing protein [Candidatus Rokubacteria bacterium]|nr:DUF4242 domain-containing protein [Candidatus Rokubacteria bacterium]
MTPNEGNPVECEVRIAARPETVFAFFTDPAKMTRWKGLRATLDDHPSMPPLPAEVAQEMTIRIKAGKADEFGVRPLNVLVTTSGQGYCLTEAPDADAVVKAHQAKGFPLSHRDVAEVTSLV